MTDVWREDFPREVYDFPTSSEDLSAVLPVILSAAKDLPPSSQTRRLRSEPALREAKG